jgi:hypothetical protein
MEILYIGLFTVIASAVGTLTGFGTSTIMVPILIQFLPLPQTLLLVGIIHWFGNIWKITLFHKGFRWRLILTFGVPGIIAAYVGAMLMTELAISEYKDILKRILGGFMIAYAVFLFLKPKIKVKADEKMAMVGGGLSGFCAGIFGVGGAVRGMFLSAFDLPKEVYIATAGAIGFVIDTMRLSTYTIKGVRLESQLVWGFLLFVPASFIGARIAKKFVEKIPQQRFRQVICIFLLLAGLKLLVFP